MLLWVFSRPFSRQFYLFLCTNVRVHRRVDSPAVLFIFCQIVLIVLFFAAYMIILLSRTIWLIVGVEGSWEKHSLCQLVC